MKDFPVFTTENGVGSLILREIPYRQTAYIRILDTLKPETFLAECTSFCKAVGAEYVYATGHEYLRAYPLYTTMLQMHIRRVQLSETDAALLPVEEQTLEQWRQIYNKRMKTVPNAAYMTVKDGKDMLSRGEGYFIYRGDSLLGIGMVSGNQLRAVASVVPGAGRDCVLALTRTVAEGEIRLEVASTNVPAVRLYERMGFVMTKHLSSWYRIVPLCDAGHVEY